MQPSVQTGPSQGARAGLLCAVRDARSASDHPAPQSARRASREPPATPAWPATVQQSSTSSLLAPQTALRAPWGSPGSTAASAPTVVTMALHAPGTASCAQDIRTAGPPILAQLPATSAARRTAAATAGRRGGGTTPPRPAVGGSGPPGRALPCAATPGAGWAGQAPW